MDGNWSLACDMECVCDVYCESAVLSMRRQYGLVLEYVSTTQVLR